MNTLTVHERIDEQVNKKVDVCKKVLLVLGALILVSVIMYVVIEYGQTGAFSFSGLN